MSTPSNAEAQIETPGSDTSGSDTYRSPSVSPREFPRAKKARLELEHDPTYEPQADLDDDEVYIVVKCLYKRIHVYICMYLTIEWTGGVISSCCRNGGRRTRCSEGHDASNDWDTL